MVEGLPMVEEPEAVAEEDAVASPKPLVVEGALEEADSVVVAERRRRPEEEEGEVEVVGDETTG